MVVEDEDAVVVAEVGRAEEAVGVEDRGEGLVGADVVLLEEEAGVDQEEVDLLDEVVDVVDSRSRFCTDSEYNATNDCEREYPSSNSIILLYTCNGRPTNIGAWIS